MSLPERDAPKVCWRVARSSDLPRIRDIIAAAFENVTIFHILEQRYGIMGGRPWREWKTAQIDRFFAQYPEWVQVAEVDGEVVGVVTYQLDRQRKIGTIGNNGVDPRYQGRGIGTAMYAYVLDIFRQVGMRYAEVATGLSDSAAPARRAYEKVGFRPLTRSVHYFQELEPAPGCLPEHDIGGEIGSTRQKMGEGY